MNSHASDDAALPRTSAEALLESMERVRALAGHVVRQAADQDDLVQEAVVRALSKPSTLVGESGPWVRRVVRNLGIDRQRATARRQDRELGAGDAEASQESTLDSVARAECQRDLVDTVLKLPEPYRAVILCRFFDGLPPREIAKKHGVPVATVKKQQERGMALLRKELEGRYGNDGAWAVALLPIVPKSMLKGLSALAAKGVGSGSFALAPRWIAFALAALVSIAVPILLINDAGWDDASVVVPGVEPLDSVAQVEQQAPKHPQAVTGGRSAPPSQSAAVLPASAAASAVLRTFTGRFVDESGSPIPRVTATCRTASELTGEDAGGESGTPGRGSADGVVFASLDAPLDAPMIVEVEASGFAPAVYRFLSESSGFVGGVVDVGRQTLFPAVDVDVGVVDGDGNALLGWGLSYFYYGGGDRLERARLAADAVTGRARFEGIAATEVEVIAQHESGLEIRRPSRPLRAGEVNSMDLVYLGSDPSRRVGAHLEWPAVASPAKNAVRGEALEISLYSEDQRVATQSVALGERQTAFEGLAPGYYSMRVEDPRFEVEEAAVQTGTSARLVVRGNAQLALTLREPAGRVLTDYVVELLLDGVPPRELLREGHELPFGGLVPGRPFVLRMTAPDGRQAIREVAPLAPRETRVLDLALGEGVTLVRVQVVRGEALVPVAGAEVALLDGALVAGSERQLRAEARMKGFAQGVTDGSGTATFQVATHAMGANVTALASAVDRASAPVTRGGARIVLSDLGTVRVLPRGLARGLVRKGELPDGVALTLTWPGSVSGVDSSFGPGLRLERAEDGSFVTASAPVGPVTLWLSLSDFNRAGRGTPLGGITGPVGYPVGEVDVQAGVETELAVDLGEFLPGRVEVVVRHAGQLLADAVVELEPAGSHAHLPYPFGADVNVSRVLTQLTDGSGRAVFPRVPKGRWQIRVRDIEWLWVTSGGEVDVSAGKRDTALVDAVLAEGEIVLVDAASGEPLRSSSVEIKMGARGAVRRTTDAKGALRLRLGPGSYPLSSPVDGEATTLTGTLEWDVDGPVRSVVRLSK